MNCETAAAVARQVERRVGRHGVATKKERAEQASRFLTAIASCGRKFFAHNGRVSRFEVDDRGRIWFVDAYREAKIYTACKWGSWRGFSEGGTLRSLVLQLCDFIRSGTPATIHLGPWPDWICNGDLWGYGGDMEKVRQAAQAAGLVPSNVEHNRRTAASSPGVRVDGPVGPHTQED